MSRRRSRRARKAPFRIQLGQLKGLVELVSAVRRPTGGIHLVLGGPAESRRALETALIERLGDDCVHRALVSYLETPTLEAEVLEPPAPPRQLLLTHSLYKSELAEGTLLPLLNLYRERLGAPRVHTVLWLEDEEDYLSLQRQAPDLWAFRRRLYRALPTEEGAREDAGCREWLVDALGKQLEPARARYPWFTPDRAWAGADTVVDEVGLLPLWEHLQLWQDTTPDERRIEPLARFLKHGEGELPSGLKPYASWLLELEIFREPGPAEGRGLPTLESPLNYSFGLLEWGAEKQSPLDHLPELPGFAVGGLELEALHEAIQRIHREGGIAWLTGPRGSGKTTLALAHALVYADEFDGAVYLPCERGLAPAIRSWFTAAGRTLGAETSDLEAVQALRQALGERQVLLVLDDCQRLEDVKLCRSVLPSATLVVCLSPELEIAARTTTSEFAELAPVGAPELEERLTVRRLPAALWEGAPVTAGAASEVGEVPLGDSREAAPDKPEIELDERRLRLGRERDALRASAAEFADARRFEEAIRSFDQVLSLDRVLGDRETESLDLSLLGRALAMSGNVPRALEVIDDALNVARAVKSHKGQLVALYCRANALNEGQRPEEAESSFREALLLAEAVGDPSGQMMVRNDLGSHYVSVGEFEKAVQTLVVALSIAQEIGDRSAEQKLVQNVGNAYLGLQQPRKALRYLRRGAMLAKQRKHAGEEAVMLVLSGVARLLLGQLTRARADLESALTLSQSAAPHLVDGIRTLLAAPEMQKRRRPRKKPTASP